MKLIGECLEGGKCTLVLENSETTEIINIENNLLPPPNPLEIPDFHMSVF